MRCPIKATLRLLLFFFPVQPIPSYWRISGSLGTKPGTLASALILTSAPCENLNPRAMFPRVSLPPSILLYRIRTIERKPFLPLKVSLRLDLDLPLTKSLTYQGFVVPIFIARAANRYKLKREETAVPRDLDRPLSDLLSGVCSRMIS